MAIHFREDANDDISVSPDADVPEVAWTEIAALLLAFGATPLGNGVLLPPLSLRLAAQDVGQLIERHDLEVVYDSSVRQLLQLHLDEFTARADAEQDTSVLAQADVLRMIEASGRYRRSPTQNQLRDLGRLLRLVHGANFSVPGAGKTATLLATYEALRAQERVDHLLVVAPKNAFLSWEQEVAACYPDAEARPTVARISGGYLRAIDVISSNPEIALITYQFLPNVLEPLRTWARRHKTHLVLDESHRAKSGIAGVYAFAALRLSSASRRRDILSGTPMPNAPEDLRAQIEFLWPGQRVLPDQRLKADTPPAVLEEVQRSVSPLYVRTTKHELELPPLTAVPVPVELGALQRELYELLRSEASRAAAGFAPNDMRLLRKLGSHVMGMLEAASNPMLLATSDALMFSGEEGVTSQVWELLREVARSERPAKITKAIEIVEQSLAAQPDRKILIWTSFVQNVLLLERLLAAYKPVTLYGAIVTGSDEDEDTREGKIRIFHTDPNCRVMVANPAACGEGISLHKACHHAIYLDRTFNAAHYLQSIDRIHRLGLGPHVLTRVEILEARWTIDTRVAKRLKLKIDSMSRILNDPGLAALAYDPVDVVEEFPAGIQPEDLEEILDHIVQGEKDGK